MSIHGDLQENHRRSIKFRALSTSTVLLSSCFCAEEVWDRSVQDEDLVKINRSMYDSVHTCVDDWP
ncbi:MAG: hypothetical protein QXO25_07040 [Candidatus Bathyarchaeia archaeon]